MLCFAVRRALRGGDQAAMVSKMLAWRPVEPEITEKARGS